MEGGTMKTQSVLAGLVAVVVAACSGAPVGSLLPSLPDRTPPIAPGTVRSPAAVTAEPTGEPPSSADATRRPEPTSAESPSTTAEPSELPVETDSPVPSDSPLPSPDASPVASPQVYWTEPELAAEGRYSQPDVLVDDEGFVHAAVAGAGNNNRGIWYLTNSTGGWTIEQASIAPGTGDSEEGGYDGEPSIALDEQGNVWIAFTRWTCWECAPNPSVGIFLTTNEQGDAWALPVQVTGDQTNSPSLLVRDGERHFAFAEG